MQQLRDRVGEHEQRLSHAEDAIPPLQELSNQDSRLIAQLQQKQDDLKNSMRRNNLRFIGLPEGVEGANPATFLEELFITAYGREAFYVICGGSRSPDARQ